MSDGHDDHPQDGQEESRRQRAIDLAQTVTAAGMLYFGTFDTQASQPEWILGAYIILGLVVFEIDSRVYRLVEASLILTIPVSYAIWRQVDIAYLFTALVMFWNGLDWAIASLSFINRGKKALIKIMEKLG